MVESGFRFMVFFLKREGLVQQGNHPSHTKTNQALLQFIVCCLYGILLSCIRVMLCDTHGIGYYIWLFRIICVWCGLCRMNYFLSMPMLVSVSIILIRHSIAQSILPPNTCSLHKYFQVIPLDMGTFSSFGIYLPQLDSRSLKSQVQESQKNW